MWVYYDVEQGVKLCILRLPDVECTSVAPWPYNPSDRLCFACPVLVRHQFLPLETVASVRRVQERDSYGALE